MQFSKEQFGCFNGMLFEANMVIIPFPLEYMVTVEFSSFMHKGS